jgi:lysophospholipase L1-like esterase
MKRGRRALRVAAVAAALALLLELFARLAGTEPPHVYSGRVRRPVQRCMAWLKEDGGAVMQCTNAWGLVGPLPVPGDRRVIAIGSSTTECPYMAAEETWPVCLQRALEAQGLHVWVGNAGVSGSTAVGQAIYLEDRLLELEPELVLFMPGANDRRPLDPRQDAGMLAPARTPWYTALVQHSRALAWCQRQFARHGVAVPRRSAMDPRACLDTGLDMAGHLQQQTEYRARLMRVVERCQARGVRLVLLTQPTGCTPGSPVDAVMELYNTTLRAVAQAQQLPLIDLAAPEWERDACFLDAIHFSSAGAARASALMAPAVRDLFGDPLKAPTVPLR